MYYNIITNKYNIGNVYWSDFEEIIREYMVDIYSKFYFFSTLVKCKVNNIDISILVSKRTVMPRCIDLTIVDGFIISIVTVKKYEIIYFIALL